MCMPRCERTTPVWALSFGAILQHLQWCVHEVVTLTITRCTMLCSECLRIIGRLAGILEDEIRQRPRAALAKEIEAEFFAKGRPSPLLQRMVETGEVANMVTYLAGPLSIC